MTRWCFVFYITNIDHAMSFITSIIASYKVNPDDFMNPDSFLPFIAKEPVHIGYTPLDEDVAFLHSNTYMKHIFPHHFLVSREKMDLNTLISCIRKVLWWPNNDIHVCIPKFQDHYTRSILYRTTCVLTQIDVGYANIMIEVNADPANNSYLVEANRFSGDRELFYRFYQTLKYYVENGGTVDPSIPYPSDTHFSIPLSLSLDP
jgi:hypothetical protein